MTSIPRGKEVNMAGRITVTCRGSQRANNKKGESRTRASRIEDRALRGVLRGDRQRVARAEQEAYDAEVNQERTHHARGGFTAWRRDGGR